MPISVFCQGCQKTYRVKDELAGKRGKCPQGHALVIPSDDAAAPPVAPAPKRNPPVTSPGPRASRKSAPAEDPKPGSRKVLLFAGIGAAVLVVAVAAFFVLRPSTGPQAVADQKSGGTDPAADAAKEAARLKAEQDRKALALAEATRLEAEREKEAQDKAEADRLETERLAKLEKDRLDKERLDKEAKARKEELAKKREPARPDAALLEAGLTKLRALKYNPVAVYSTGDKVGTVRLVDGKKAEGKDAVAVVDGASLTDGTWDLRADDVLFNAGTATRVKVGDDELKPGECVLFKGNKFTRLDLTVSKDKDPVKPPDNTPIPVTIVNDYRSTIDFTISNAEGKYTLKPKAQVVVKLAPRKDYNITMKYGDKFSIAINIEASAGKDWHIREPIPGGGVFVIPEAAGAAPDQPDADVTKRYVLKVNKIDPKEPGGVVLKNSVAELRVTGPTSELMNPGDTLLVKAKGATISDLTFAEPCELKIGKDKTVLATKENVTATDARGKVWKSRKVRMNKEEVFAFFPE